jgi:aspartate/methionine/tyrosine aminotransferase
MAGRKVRWVVGHSEVLKNILKVKSNMDSGMFKPVQLAACEALKIDRSWYSRILEEYSLKRKLAEKLANCLNLTFRKEQKGMFLWCHYGKGVDEYVDKLLYEKSIFIAPGKIFGSKGEEYIRISLSTDSSIIEEAIKRVS